MRQIILALSFGLAATTYGQTDIYTPYRNQDLWSADTLFVGAGFARNLQTFTQNASSSPKSAKFSPTESLPETRSPIVSYSGRMSQLAERMRSAFIGKQPSMPNSRA